MCSTHRRAVTSSDQSLITVGLFIFSEVLKFGIMYHQKFSNSSKCFSHCCYEKRDKREMSICESSSRKRGRPISNAARERSRVKTLRSAFLDLQETLPSVPPDTKLSKLDVLILATTYITHLMKTLDNATVEQNQDECPIAAYHPLKKWPMRTRLYDGILDSTKPVIGTKRKKKEYYEMLDSEVNSS